jgi:hypothetical protein
MDGQAPRGQRGQITGSTNDANFGGLSGEFFCQEGCPASTSIELLWRRRVRPDVLGPSDKVRGGPSASQLSDVVADDQRVMFECTYRVIPPHSKLSVECI